MQTHKDHFRVCQAVCSILPVHHTLMHFPAFAGDLDLHTTLVQGNKSSCCCVSGVVI